MSRVAAPTVAELKLVLTALNGHPYGRQTTIGVEVLSHHRRFVATVTREENRVQMIMIHTQQVLVANCEGLFPASSAAVMR